MGGPNSNSITEWMKGGMSPVVAAEMHCLAIMLRIKETYRNFKWYDQRGTVGFCAFSKDLRTIFRDVCKNSSILFEPDEPYDFAEMPQEKNPKGGTRIIAGARLYHAANILEKLFDSQDEGHRLLLEGASACKTLGQMYYAYHFAAADDRNPPDYSHLFEAPEKGYVEREYDTQSDVIRNMEASAS